MNFDLNIDNYNKADIENLLDLKFPYSTENITEKCEIFKNSIVNNNNLDKNLILSIQTFLDKIKFKIINNLSESNSQLITSQNFENPHLNESKVLLVGNSPIIEQQMRTEKSDNPSSLLPSKLSYSLSGNLAPGKINPLYKRFIKKSLTIDSRFRDNYFKTSSSNFLVNLPMTFNNVISMQLSSLELPTTYYSVSNNLGNNTFYIMIRLAPSTVNHLNKSLDSICTAHIANGNIIDTNADNSINDDGEILTKFSFDTSIEGFPLNARAFTTSTFLNELDQPIDPEDLSSDDAICNNFAIAEIKVQEGNYTHTEMTKEINNQLDKIFTNTVTINKNDGSSVYSSAQGKFIKMEIDVSSTDGAGTGLTIIASSSSSLASYIKSQLLGIEEEAYANAEIINSNGEKKLITVPASDIRFSLYFKNEPIKGSLKDLGFSYVLNYLNDPKNITATPKLGKILGFNLGKYTSYDDLKAPYDLTVNNETNDSNTSEIESYLLQKKGLSESGCAYISESFYECAGPRYLFLVVEDFNNNVSDGLFSALNSSLLNQNILARISVKGSPFSVLADDSLNVTKPERIYFGPVTLDKIKIQILDEFGRVVDLHHMDFSMELILNTLYDK